MTVTLPSGIDTYYGLESPAKRLVAITPSDTVDLTTVIRGIYVGLAGSIAVLALDDSTAVTLQNVPAGVVLPICTRRINATGTTASALVGLI